MGIHRPMARDSMTTSATWMTGSALLDAITSWSPKILEDFFPSPSWAIDVFQGRHDLYTVIVSLNRNHLDWTCLETYPVCNSCTLVHWGGLDVISVKRPRSTQISTVGFTSCSINEASSVYYLRLSTSALQRASGVKPVRKALECQSLKLAHSSNRLWCK